MFDMFTRTLLFLGLFLINHVFSDSTRLFSRLNELEKKNKILSSELIVLQSLYHDLVEIHKRKSKPIQKRDVTCGSQTQQPIVFHATMNDYFNPIGENQILVYDSLVTNVGIAYDQFNGLFKAPYDGLYQFIATSWSTDGHYLQFEIVKNNQDICFGRAGTHDQSMGVCAAVVELSRGDKVWVRHQGTRGDYAEGKYYPSFAGHLIL